MKKVKAYEVSEMLLWRCPNHMCRKENYLEKDTFDFHAAKNTKSYYNPGKTEITCDYCLETFLINRSGKPDLTIWDYTIKRRYSFLELLAIIAGVELQEMHELFLELYWYRDESEQGW